MKILKNLFNIDNTYMKIMQILSRNRTISEIDIKCYENEDWNV